MLSNLSGSNVKTMKFLILLMKLYIWQKNKCKDKHKPTSIIRTPPILDNTSTNRYIDQPINDYDEFKKYVALKNAASSFSNPIKRTPSGIPSSANNIINQRTPPRIISKTNERISLDIIQTQIDVLLATDVNSLSTIMTIDYFNKVLDLLNSLKDNMNTDDIAIRDRLILMLQVIFSFINANKTNLNLKQNMTDISYKYNNIVDKLYPNNHNIQPLSRVIKLNIEIDPIYDLYIQRYGLPSGNFFDNSKLLELKSEFSI